MAVQLGESRNFIINVSMDLGGTVERPLCPTTAWTPRAPCPFFLRTRSGRGWFARPRLVGAAQRETRDVGSAHPPIGRPVKPHGVAVGGARLPVVL